MEEKPTGMAAEPMLPPPPGIVPTAPANATGPIEAAATPPGAPGQATPADAGDEDDDGKDHRGVAILLGAAAIAAAIVAALAVGLASDASDAWNSAVRLEVKRSAGALQDVRYLYQSEFPMALSVMGARAQAAAYGAAASANPEQASALRIAGNAQTTVADTIAPSVALTKGDTYALPGGGVDLGRRLADLRNEYPDLLALDPDAMEAQGDAAAAKAHRLLLALLPLGACALLGTLAQAFRRARTPLLAVGSVLLGAGVIVALVAQVAA